MDTNTGKIYTAEEIMEMADVDEFMTKFMPDHVLLKRLPRKNCKKCYGVGHLGKNLTTGKYVPCRCTQ